MAKLQISEAHQNVLTTQSLPLGSSLYFERNAFRDCLCTIAPRAAERPDQSSGDVISTADRCANEAAQCMCLAPLMTQYISVQMQEPQEEAEAHCSSGRSRRGGSREGSVTRSPPPLTTLAHGRTGMAGTRSLRQ